MEAECSPEKLIPLIRLYIVETRKNTNWRLAVYCLPVHTNLMQEVEGQADRGGNSAVGTCQNAWDCISARPWYAKCSQQPRE